MKYGSTYHLIDTDNNKMYPFSLLDKDTFLTKPDPVLLEEVAVNNIGQCIKSIRFLSNQDPVKRMFCLNSGILPLYTIPKIRKLYKRFLPRLEIGFSKMGKIARDNNVRLCFYNKNLSLTTQDNFDKSIKAIEYYTSCAYMMGYARSLQDFSIIINSGHYPNRIKKLLAMLSPEAMMLLAVENSDTLKPRNLLDADLRIPVILNMTNYISLRNRFLEIDSYTIKRIIDTWYNRTPIMNVDIIMNKKFINTIHEYSSIFDIICTHNKKNLAVDKILNVIEE